MNSYFQNRRWFIVFLAALLWVMGSSPVAANGIPVQVFLDHLPFKATWQPANGGRGVAVVSANDEQVRVMAQNLPTPPAGQVYYAWLEKAEGGFLPVGSMNYQSDGTASIDQHMEALPYSENFSWVLISLEDPTQIGAGPSLEIALAGRLPNPQALPLRSNESPALLPVTGAEAAIQESGNGAITLAIVLLLSVVTVFFVAIRRSGMALLRRTVVKQAHPNKRSGR